MRKSIYLVFSIGMLISCKGNQTPTQAVIATNAWTAAYAIAAGATDVRVLTPYEMIHPSEYELRPGDIAQLKNAEMVIYAGYENMIGHIRSALEIPEKKMVRILTSYNMAEIEESVMVIANRLGTEEQARKNLHEIRKTMEDTRQVVIEMGLGQKTAVVHFFQQSFANEAGIETVAVFGPAPPEPRQILEITRTEASLIIDNAHNPSGGALQKTMDNANYLLLLNFPGLHGTRTIEDVIEYNSVQLKQLREK